jgi:hypothetical protein
MSSLAFTTRIVYFTFMAFKTITISVTAYERLKKLKEPGESFSEVVLRELPDPCDTCGDILHSFKHRPVPRANPKLREAMLAGRGRRSPRRI